MVISIFDLSGKVLKTGSFGKAGAEIEMNINDLNAGAFLVKMQSGAEIHLLKLIKK